MTTHNLTLAVEQFALAQHQLSSAEQQLADLERKTANVRLHVEKHRAELHSARSELILAAIEAQRAETAERAGAVLAVDSGPSPERYSQLETTLTTALVECVERYGWREMFNLLDRVQIDVEHSLAPAKVSTTACAKCGTPIDPATPHVHLNGIGHVHASCPELDIMTTATRCATCGGWISPGDPRLLLTSGGAAHVSCAIMPAGIMRDEREP